MDILHLSLALLLNASANAPPALILVGGFGTRLRPLVRVPEL